MNLESLVTKEFLKSRLADLKTDMNTRFAEQKSYLDKRFAEQDAKIETRFAEVKGNFRIMYWFLSVITTAILVPFLQQLLTL